MILELRKFDLDLHAALETFPLVLQACLCVFPLFCPMYQRFTDVD